MENNSAPSQEILEQSLTEITVESWRFARLFSRLMEKLDAGDSSRYVNQYRFYLKRLEDSLSQAGMRLVNLEGQPYDAGMAATAINSEDFEQTDQLVVDHMVEPIIMGSEGVLKTGTLMLKKVP